MRDDRPGRLRLTEEYERIAKHQLPVQRFSSTPDRFIKERLHAEQWRMARLLIDLLARSSAPECPGLDVTDDPQSILRPAGKDQVPCKGSGQIGGAFRLDRNRVRVAVRAFKGWRPVMRLQISAQRRIRRSVNVVGVPGGIRSAIPGLLGYGRRVIVDG